jgi:hypothetical protein
MLTVVDFRPKSHPSHRHEGILMTTSILRRVSVSAMTVAAVAAFGFGGSTEAWGMAHSTQTKHQVVDGSTSAWGSTSLGTTDGRATTDVVSSSKTSAWG